MVFPGGVLQVGSTGARCDTSGLRKDREEEQCSATTSSRPCEPAAAAPRDETRDAVEPGEIDDVLTQLGGEFARLVPGSR